MAARGHRIPLLATAALLLATTIVLALGHELSETKEQLQLKYEVSAVVHDSGRVTVNLTIADQGKLKPLDSVQLAVPSQDKSGFYDLSISLATEIVDGKLTARAHLSRDLADRAEFHLVTHTPLNEQDGKSERTWYYHTIPVAKYIKDAAQKQ
jgi:hypothetical protein